MLGLAVSMLIGGVAALMLAFVQADDEGIPNVAPYGVSLACVLCSITFCAIGIGQERLKQMKKDKPHKPPPGRKKEPTDPRKPDRKHPHPFAPEPGALPPRPDPRKP